MSETADSSPTRRQFLQGFAAALGASALAGCAEEEKPAKPVKPAPVVQTPPAPAARPEKNELFDLLGAYAFTDNQGNEVNMAGLRAAMGQNNVAVSFGFQRCKAVCPQVNDSLAGLGKRVPGLKYLVVSTDRRDNENQAERDTFLQELVDRGMDRRDITILYPKDRSNQHVLQQKMGAPSAVPVGGPGHTSYIFLYNAEGRQVAKTTGKTTNPETAVDALLKMAGSTLSSVDMGR